MTENVVRCNHCKAALLAKHRRAHALDCAARKRTKRLDSLALERDGKRMYAIAAARYVGPTEWKKEIHYVHAEDCAHARAQFCYAEPNRTQVRILGVGLALGWQADRETGEVLREQG
jgi:hypothetical protein